MTARRALAGALVPAALGAALAAPPSHARPSVVVQASAVARFGGFERMDVTWQCSTVDAGLGYAWLSRCSFGPVDAYPECQDFECSAEPFLLGTGNFALGPDYQLCVAAIMAEQYVSRCAPFDYATGTAVVAG